MATAADVARLIEGAGDYDEVIKRVQDAGLSIQSDVGHVLVGAAIAVSQVGGNVRAKPYWVVYAISDPETTKVKVRGA